MLLAASWILLALGIGHIVCGLVWFRSPITKAISEGFIGKFMGVEPRVFDPIVSRFAYSTTNTTISRYQIKSV
jgi:hypothetical protein